MTDEEIKRVAGKSHPAAQGKAQRAVFPAHRAFVPWISNRLYRYLSDDAMAHRGTARATTYDCIFWLYHSGAVEFSQNQTRQG